LIQALCARFRDENAESPRRDCRQGAGLSAKAEKQSRKAAEKAIKEGIGRCSTLNTKALSEKRLVYNLVVIAIVGIKLGGSICSHQTSLWGTVTQALRSANNEIKKA
jgi:hypothetical protein